MKQPNKPIKPTEPTKPQETTTVVQTTPLDLVIETVGDDNFCYECGGGGTSTSRLSISDLQHLLQEMETLANETGNSLEDLRLLLAGNKAHVTYSNKVPNPDYKKQSNNYLLSLQKYEKKLATYKQDLQDYRQNIKKFNEEQAKAELEAAHAALLKAQERINKLTKEA
jgi:hypothetical protein